MATFEQIKGNPKTTVVQGQAIREAAQDRAVIQMWQAAKAYGAAVQDHKDRRTA